MSDKFNTLKEIYESEINESIQKVKIIQEIENNSNFYLIDKELNTITNNLNKINIIKNKFSNVGLNLLENNCEINSNCFTSGWSNIELLTDNCPLYGLSNI